MRRRSLLLTLVMAGSVCATAVPGSSVATVTLSRLSVSSDGRQGDLASRVPSITPDGRYVVFTSEATNLVQGDTNGVSDVYLRDRTDGHIESISIASDGSFGDRSSHTTLHAISADGRYVAFTSGARNLVPDDTNGVYDVFVRDRSASTVTRASLGPGGTQLPNGAPGFGISADGRFVLFAANDGVIPGDTNGEQDAFIRDMQTGEVELAAVTAAGAAGNGASWYPSISGDGRYVAFVSWADDLVAGDTNGSADVFLRDRVGGTTILVSRSTIGGSGGAGSSSAISADGRFVAFISASSDLVAGDTNGHADAFIYDAQTGSLERIMAADGHEPNGQVWPTTISSDGRFVGLLTDASNLGPTDGNVVNDSYRLDRSTGGFVRLSKRGPGGEGIQSSGAVAVTDDARFAAFNSYSDDLVDDDTNGQEDVFLATVTEVVDETPPPVELTGTSPASPANHNRPSVLGTSEPDARIRVYRSGDCTGTPVEAVAGPAFAIPVDVPDDAASELSATATDAAGNTSSCAGPLTYVEDSLAPVTTIDAAPAAFVRRTDAAIAFHATEPATFTCSLDGGTWNACTSPATYAGLSEGPHVFGVRASDAAGNAEPEGPAVRWTVDLTPPAIALAGTEPGSPANENRPKVGGTSEAGATVHIYASANCMGTSVDGAASPGFAIQVDVADDSSTTFTARASDPAGNVSACTEAITYIEDSRPPSTVIDSAPSDLVGTADATITFHASEPGTFTCSLDGDAWRACSSPITFRGLRDGSHTFTVRARDLAGNADPNPPAARWSSDVTPPATWILGYPPAATRQTTAGFTFRASEPATFECALDGGPFAPCSSPRSYSGLGERDHTFSVRATDALGNVNTVPTTYAWTVDLTPPAVWMTTPDDTLFVRPFLPVDLAAHADDAGSGMAAVCFEVTRVDLDGSRHALGCVGATRRAGPSWHAAPDLGSGRYDVRARATDQAGNGAVSGPVRIVVL